MHAGAIACGRNACASEGEVFYAIARTFGAATIV